MRAFKRQICYYISEEEWSAMGKRSFCISTIRMRVWSIFFQNVTNPSIGDEENSIKTLPGEALLYAFERPSGDSAAVKSKPAPLTNGFDTHGDFSNHMNQQSFFKPGPNAVLAVHRKMVRLIFIFWSSTILHFHFAGTQGYLLFVPQALSSGRFRCSSRG